MLWNTQRCRVTVDGREAECILFGTGSRKLVLLPGLGDSLREGDTPALPMAFLYRRLARHFRVAVICRTRPQPHGATTRDMAADLAEILLRIGFEKADVVGVSMGGMVAQHLAADAPELVGKLVLVVTCGRPNAILTASLDDWCAMADRGDHRALMVDNLRRIYTPAYCRKNGWMIPLVARLTRPRSYDQFLIDAEACRNHDAWEQILQIQAPTLILGGEKDLCLGGDASRELAARIPGAQLKMYPAQGHGLYEEAPDFQQTILDFLLK